MIKEHFWLKETIVFENNSGLKRDALVLYKCIWLKRNNYKLKRNKYKLIRIIVIKKKSQLKIIKCILDFWLIAWFILKDYSN